MSTAQPSSGTRIALAGLLCLAVSLPAQAQSCAAGNDDADVVACAQQNLNEHADKLQRAYDRLAEALGPRAAAGLPEDQAHWVKRVADHCDLGAADDLQALIAKAARTAQRLCLQQFVEARGRDLGHRVATAKKEAAAFASKDYPRVSSTWGDRLNPGHEAPLGRFAAFYLRSGDPATLVAKDTVDEVAIRYPYSEFHGIKSEDFEGYWVGRFQYEKETPVHIAVDQSWSRTRVIVDRKLVYEGGGNARVPFVFSPGTHTVEVEFINNWHTTSLSVSFAEAARPLARSELRARLRELAPESAVVQHVSVYESGQRDASVVLTLAPSERPTILALSSYRAVRWVIRNPARVEVRAIAYGSFSPGARVQTDAEDRAVPRLLADRAIGGYNAAPRCHCVGGIFHCEGGDLGSTVRTISSVLGFEVGGFTGEYAAKSLTVPKVPVTPEVLANARAELERIGKARGECRGTTRMK